MRYGRTDLWDGGSVPRYEWTDEDGDELVVEPYGHEAVFTTTRENVGLSVVVPRAEIPALIEFLKKLG